MDWMRISEASRKYNIPKTSLYELYKKVDKPYPGCLVFWYRGEKIGHVETCVYDGLSLGASGGGSDTIDAGVAARKNAYVKMNPIEGRGRIAGYVDPFI